MKQNGRKETMCFKRVIFYFCMQVVLHSQSTDHKKVHNSQCQGRSVYTESDKTCLRCSNGNPIFHESFSNNWYSQKTIDHYRITKHPVVYLFCRYLTTLLHDHVPNVFLSQVCLFCVEEGYSGLLAMIQLTYCSFGGE